MPAANRSIYKKPIPFDAALAKVVEKTKQTHQRNQDSIQFTSHPSMSFNSENDPAGVPSYQTPQLKIGEPYLTRQLQPKKNSTLPSQDGFSLILPREERIFDDARENIYS
jgi:hypothetical protein